MSQQLHRRNPSQESMEHLIPSSSAMIPHSSSVYTSTSPEQRKAKHPIHPIPEDHDLEMNATKTAPLSSTIPSKLKSKSSTVSDEKIGSGGVGNALPASAVKAVYSCGMYSFCSVSMILVNKSLASSYNHLIDGHLNILLVVFQAVVAVVCVETCKRQGWIERYPDLTWDVARAWAPVNVLFCAMLFTGMASLQTNSVPIVTVFKNITNVFTTAGDYFFFGNKPEPMITAAFAIMLFGAVAAAWNDIAVSAVGLFWMSTNCASTAGYVLYMKFATANVKLTKFGMVHVNNVLCIAFLLPAALILGEVITFLDSAEIHTIDYFFKNIFAGFVGFFLNFASLNCVQATGPTTYAIVGSLSKVPVAFLGYVLFDNIISFDTWCYIAVSMCGGFLYSYAMIEKTRKGHKT